MSFRKQVLAFVLFDLVCILFLAGYLFFPVSYRPMKIGELSSVFPDWEISDYQHPYWEGKAFRDAFGRLEVVWRENDACGKVKPPSPLELRKVSPGTLFLTKAPHGYIAGFFFCRGDKLYWIEIVSWSRLSRNLEIFLKVLENMKYEGQPLFKEKPTFKTGWPVVKDRKLVLALASLGIVFLSSIYLLLFPLFGKCPAGEALCFSASMVKFRDRRFFRSRPCCLCIKGGKVLIYTKGYPPVELLLKEAEIKGEILEWSHLTVYLNRPLSKEETERIKET